MSKIKKKTRNMLKKLDFPKIKNQSKLQRYLRDHNIHIDISYSIAICNKKWELFCIEYGYDPFYESLENFETYEEALEEGLQQSLLKLIHGDQCSKPTCEKYFFLLSSR